MLFAQRRIRQCYFRLADADVAYALEALALVADRKDHMAGQLAKALLDQFLEKGWQFKLAGERALELTPVGRQRLGGLLPSANALD